MYLTAQQWHAKTQTCQIIKCQKSREKDLNQDRLTRYQTLAYGISFLLSELFLQFVKSAKAPMSNLALRMAVHPDVNSDAKVKHNGFLL